MVKKKGKLKYTHPHLKKTTSASYLHYNYFKSWDTYLSQDEALALNGNKTTNVILDKVLRTQVKEINSIKVSN